MIESYYDFCQVCFFETNNMPGGIFTSRHSKYQVIKLIEKKISSEPIITQNSGKYGIIYIIKFSSLKIDSIVVKKCN